MQKVNIFLRVLIALLIAVVCVISGIFGGVAVYAATSAQYTNALEDLQMDSTFNADDYSLNTADYSLQVIQIAESQNDELFLYVYQPSGQVKSLRASTINISTAINDSLSYTNYKLDYINSYGVFFKYKVQDFALKGDVVRYYDISSIYRVWDKNLDKALDNGNEVTEVAYEVGQLWTACTLNGEVSYSMLTSETITITDKYVGLVRYSNGFKLYVSKCDAHFVAFSTDRQIDKLMEADVHFLTQRKTSQTAAFVGTSISYGDKQENYAYLKYTDVTGNSADGLFGKKYTWNRIESAADFVKNEDLTDEGKADVANKQWVLRFYESGYSLSSGYGTSTEYSTIVSEVTILRLKFETDGKVYNLGVIDNKQTGDGIPDNNNTNEFDFSLIGSTTNIWSLIKLVLGLVVIVVLLIVLLPIITPIISYLIKGIIWLVTLPFKLISKLSKARSRRKTNKQIKRNETNYDYLDEYDWDSDFWSDIDGME
jgi:hypothetical protein